MKDFMKQLLHAAATYYAFRVPDLTVPDEEELARDAERREYRRKVAAREELKEIRRRQRERPQARMTNWQNTRYMREVANVLSPVKRQKIAEKWVDIPHYKTAARISADLAARQKQEASA